ncbi:MAG: hypothetical protein HY770_01335 [Chitinivibrionia bacterium]|nr:hypothetical protein [Chitinivibrionia bacterium]
MRYSPNISKSFLVLGLSLLLSVSALDALADQEEHKHGAMNNKTNQEVTLVGEVIDLYCYMKHPADGQGPGHAKCAQTCIRKGLPIGFLSNGEIYLIIGKAEHESAKDLVVDFAGMQSRLTGTLINHDGVKAIEITKIEKVAAAPGK